MRKILLIVGVLASLTGCASQEYALYAETQQKIAQAQAMSDTARYAALAEIARQGDSAAKVAAVMSLQMSGGSGSGPRVQQVNPPRTFGDVALQWTSVLLPSLTQFYSISANRQIAVTQSNNQAAIATSTNNTFATMSNNQATSNTAIANAGFTAVTDVAKAGLTATQNTATAGINGVVTTAANGLTAATTISNNGNTAIVNVSNAANTSLQTLIGTIPSLQPNITTTSTSTSTSTSTTTNSCGSNASGGTVTCP